MLTRKIIIGIVGIYGVFLFSSCGMNAGVNEDAGIFPAGSGKLEAAQEIDAVSNEIVDIMNYSDDYTWVRYLQGNQSNSTSPQYYYAITDKAGTVTTIVNNLSDYPETGFLHGVSYVTVSNKDYVIDTNGNVIISAEGDDNNSIVAYGSDEKHAYFMIHKREADFSSSREEYIVYNESGTVLNTFTAQITYDKVWYCGETVWAFQNTENVFGAKSCKFFNHDNGLFFDVDGLASEPGWINNRFSSGFATNELTQGGRPVCINSKNGSISVYEYEDLDAYVQEYERSMSVGRMSNNVAVFLVYNYYATKKEDVPIYFFGYIKPVEKSDGSIFIETKSFDSSLVNKMFAKDISRYDNYMFDKNGHMLIQLTGADGLNYFSILNMDGKMIVDPIAYDTMYNDYISCDRFSFEYNNVLYVCDGEGRTIFSSQGTNWRKISEYSNDVAVIDNHVLIDKDGNILYNKLNLNHAQEISLN